MKTHEEPAWLYRLGLDQDQKYELRRKRFDTYKSLTHGWVIESRSVTVFEGKTTEGKWDVSYRQPNDTEHDLTTLANVINHLLAMRHQDAVNRLPRCGDDEESQKSWEEVMGRSWTEYRARIINFPHHTQNSMTYIWWHRNNSHLPLTEIWKSRNEPV